MLPCLADEVFFLRYLVFSVVEIYPYQRTFSMKGQLPSWQNFPKVLKRIREGGA
jgi:hypothetical protein